MSANPLFNQRTGPTGVVEAKGTQEEGHVGEAPVQPENPTYTGVVEAKGTQERRPCRQLYSTRDPIIQVTGRTVTRDRNGNRFHMKQSM